MSENNEISGIFIGADHRGFEVKGEIYDFLTGKNYQVIDCGNKFYDPDDDFPVFAAEVARKIIANNNSRGILICGGGQGVCMAANRFRGIRAVKIDTPEDAVISRVDNNSNILCLSANEINGNPELWQAIIEIWLKTPHKSEPRFERRNKMLDEIVS